jgi:hypothetical protein
MTQGWTLHCYLQFSSLESTRLRELLRNLSERLAFVASEGVCSHAFNYMLFLQGRRPKFHFMAVAEYYAPYHF